MSERTEVTEYTRAYHQSIRNSLPFDDETDFHDAKRGFIASWADDVVPRDDGLPSWDIKGREFLAGACPETVNPSLWRQAQLNNIHGLFEVCEGIYQVRGYDLANITFVRSENGWVVIDAGMTSDFARAARQLVDEHLGERPINGLIYTHSHIDHFGGARALLTEEEVASRNVPIIAPDGFLEESVSENILAGAAMRRRATFMYGVLLQTSDHGHVDTGLGPGGSSGAMGLVAPTDLIRKTGEERVVDGVRIQFQFTPDAEAPAEIMFYFPEFKALCTSEVVTHVQHNVYTPRGAKVRDSLAWSKYIDETLGLYPEAEIVFASHHWPIWGADRVREYLGSQRDMYKYLHDETLRLANHGMTPREIAEEICLPDVLAKQFWNRDYYGTVSHNVKAIYQLYFGWFDGNPANLNPLPPVESAKRYVAYMGGVAEILKKAEQSYEEGDYRWVAEVLNHVVFAEPEFRPARELLARACTQMGYQAESGPWRDFYLTGAQELRNGTPDIEIPFSLGSLDMVKAIPAGLLFDLLAVQLNGPKAVSHDLVLAFKFDDLGEEFIVKIRNGVLNWQAGCEVDDVQVSVSAVRDIWDHFFSGLCTLGDLLADDRVHITGDVAVLKEMFGLMDRFDVFFSIVEP